MRCLHEPASTASFVDPQILVPGRVPHPIRPSCAVLPARIKSWADRQSPALRSTSRRMAPAAAAESVSARYPSASRAIAFRFDPPDLLVGTERPHLRPAPRPPACSGQSRRCQARRVLDAAPLTSRRPCRSRKARRRIVEAVCDVVENALRLSLRPFLGVTIGKSDHASFVPPACAGGATTGNSSQDGAASAITHPIRPEPSPVAVKIHEVIARLECPGTNRRLDSGGGFEARQGFGWWCCGSRPVAAPGAPCPCPSLLKYRLLLAGPDVLKLGMPLIRYLISRCTSSSDAPNSFTP